MHDALGKGTVLGYCTNVHAGATWERTRSNLRTHAVAVKQRVSPDGPMGVGLWLSADAARAVLEAGAQESLRDFLGAEGLLAYTFNGFPWGDFHQPIVKHRVYAPDWSDPGRVAYTRDLIAILACLLPEDSLEGSISTLGVGWHSIGAEEESLRRAVENLLGVAAHLKRLEDSTGVLIHLDLEPEPGCYLQRGSDVVAFFSRHLIPGSRGIDIARYLRVCHDVCHAAVMFEEPEELFGLYDAAGIAIGKVQISSGLRVRFDDLDESDRGRALRQLGGFCEPRYLHQTVIRRRDGVVFHEDLPDALAASEPAGEWRVHFHVPINLDRIDLLGTTQLEIGRSIELLRDRGVRHWEVETYAWDVLPPPLGVDILADGIARELDWLLERSGDSTVLQGLGR